MKAALEKEGFEISLYDDKHLNFGEIFNGSVESLKENYDLTLHVANPYHLLDVPMIKTYVNAYFSSEYAVEAIIEKNYRKIRI